jgi:hypothetical protein
MIRAVLRTVCAILLILGLLWVYTFMYGGPLGPFFAWLTQFLPPNLRFEPAPVPIRPLTG